ncbi:MAG: SPOR domain-containing protein [Bryobacteraceae bacterium]|nr:SPOR domain-containing protein [Bryobacteraceae bacterium]MDW8380216.1 SPOR domain-containing protein [Bryobacterales bacterium]
MTRADDGEFELILGNKQLLSVFFVVVMLLGVFFAMGYIVGKNSIPAEAYLSKKTEPIRVDPQASQSSRSPVAETPVARPVPPVVGEAKPSQPPSPAPTPSETASSAVRPDPLADARLAPRAKEGSAPESPKTSPEVKREPKATETPRPVRKEEAKGSGVMDPVSGKSYLQVVATTRADCEIVVDVLKRKGFPAIITPGPNEKLFRVLVGPLEDSAAIARTRAELEKAGFQKPYLRKQP